MLLLTLEEMIKCMTDDGRDMVTDERPETNVKCDGNVKGNMDAVVRRWVRISGFKTSGRLQLGCHVSHDRRKTHSFR